MNVKFGTANCIMSSEKPRKRREIDDRKKNVSKRTVRHAGQIYDEMCSLRG